MTVLLMLAALGSIYYFILYPYQKVKRLKRSLVLRVHDAQTRYPDLPLGNVAIFSSADKRHRVCVIFPMLTLRSKVEYIYSWHDIHAVRVLNQKQLSAGDCLNVSVAKELAFLVHDHTRFIEPEIERLQNQRQKISALLNLVATSETYAGHQSIYERALTQVDSLLSKAEELQLIYIRAIRDILIGRQVAAYDPSLLPSDSFAIDSKYKRVREEYQTMKDVATAHAELLRTR